MTAVEFTAQLNVEYCCDCGMPFAMTADFQKRRRDDHGSFYCPAGHSQHYTGKTEAEKQRERADRLEAQSQLRGEWLESERRSHAATKGLLTKARKKLNATVDSGVES